MSTRDTVTEFLRRLGEGDLEGVTALFADKVDFRLSWPPGRYPDTPWIRERGDRAVMADHFRMLADFHVPGSNRTSLSGVLVDGADAVVLGELVNTARPTGKAYAAMIALHLTVEDGEITRFHVYEDSLAVARAFEG